MGFPKVGLQEALVYDVRAYGAVGDGVQDDTAAIQEAINTCSQAGGGVVLLPTGSFTVSSPLTLLQGVSLLGWADFSRVSTDHVTTSFLQPSPSFPTTGVPLLSIGVLGTGGAATPANPHGVSISQIGFTGVTAGGAQIAALVGAEVNDTGEVRFLNCVFIDCAGTGCQVSSQTTGSSQGSEGLHFVGCEFLSCGYGLTTTGEGTTDGYLVNCHFNNCVTANVSAGVGNLGGGGYIFEGCHFVGNTNTINTILAGTQAGPLIFNGCYFDQCINGPAISGAENLVLSGCYYLIDATSTQAAFISVPGANPRVAVSGGICNINGSTSITALVEFTAVTGVPSLSQLGPVAISSGTGSPPAQWKGTYIDKAGDVIPVVGTTAAASLSADLAIASATLTTVTSITLGLGTWLVSGSATFTNGAATAASIEASLAAGTATATFAGMQSAADELPALSGGERQVALPGCIVTVTVAGTILLNAESPNACTAKAKTATYSLPDATGITAVRVS